MRFSTFRPFPFSSLLSSIKS
uniref:Uncharacterized protein n=1 Tax=Arundo donax TaxID=35708 RepID=A0A0A8ZT29_ARUDO